MGVKLNLFILYTLLVTTNAFANGAPKTSIGDHHACAIVNLNQQGRGDLYCWGDNSHGQLGDGTTTARTKPVRPLSLGVIAVSVSKGGYTTCALREEHPGVGDDRVWCWGDNSYGQLGAGTVGGNQLTTLEIPFYAHNKAVAVAVGANHVCVELGDQGSALYCAGDNTYGQVGHGSFGGKFSIPQFITNQGYSDITAAGNTTCNIMSATVYCWGRNNYGQIGDGTTTDRASPTASGAYDSTRVTTGGDHTCAYSTGYLYCWGRNDAGQLGDLTTTNRSSPVRVAPSAYGYIFPVEVVNDIRIELGFEHTCFWGADTVHGDTVGNMYCMGWGLYGQLGLGNSFAYCSVHDCNKWNPTWINFGLRAGPDIAAGGLSSCGSWDFGPQCFGSNGYGQLGTGDYTDLYTPPAGTVGGLHY